MQGNPRKTKVRTQFLSLIATTLQRHISYSRASMIQNNGCIRATALYQFYYNQQSLYGGIMTTKAFRLSMLFLLILSAILSLAVVFSLQMRYVS
jgi:hypothetical protein